MKHHGWAAVLSKLLSAAAPVVFFGEGGCRRLENNS